MKDIRMYIFYALFVLFSGGTFADTLNDTNKLLDWAEDKFPQLFSPPIQTTQQSNEWLFRYYPSTQNYTAVKLDDLGVYVYDPSNSEDLQYKGQLPDLLVFMENNPIIFSPTQLSGIWWQVITNDCTNFSCTASAFLYKFNLTDCVENTCTGTRQSWIDNGNGWKSRQSLPLSFTWTVNKNILQFSFSTLSGRVEIYTIDRLVGSGDDDFGYLNLSTTDRSILPSGLDRTIFVKCGSSYGFPEFIAQGLC